MTTNIFDLGFSRLALGTVQFGLPYGVANRVGQPSFAQVCDILAYAVAHGVTTLDTAAGYGESEAVLGRALREIGALEQTIIVSKTRKVSQMDQERTARNIERWFRESVESSLRKLGLESLPVCLFHDPLDVEYMDILLELKEEGLVQHTGVSLGEPEQMPRLLSTPGVEAVQISLNMLDRRILEADDLLRAAEAGVAVFVRSIYLQGLLVMPIEEIMPALQEVVPVRRALQRIAEEAGLTMPEMALRYGLSLPGVTSVLTGVETLEQVKTNVAIAARGPLPAEIVAAIEEAVPDLSDTLILRPWLWPGAVK